MKTIDTDQLHSMLKNGEDIVLVNTLEKDDFDATHIPESINIPQTADDFVRRVEEFASTRYREIVVYCSSEQCDSSKQAGEKLEQAGFVNVMRYRGGAQAWQQAGHALAS